MKKLFSLGSVFLLAIGLTACTNGDVQSQIDISVVGLDGVATTEQYEYDNDRVPTMVEVLELTFDADISTSDYGNFITGIGDLEVPYGSYIAIYENDEMSTVGIDDLVIDDGDHFTFEVMWWDTTQQAVYESIQLFVDNQLDNYLSSDFIDYNVLLACQDVCVIPLTESEMETYINNMTTTTVQDYFKAIMLANTLSDTTLSDGLIAELNTMVTTSGYGQTALGLIALDSYEHSMDYSGYLSFALSYYDSSSPYDEGLDAGALGLIALAHHTEEDGVQPLIDEFVDWVIADQLPSGGIRTRDIVWNDTTYPGTENAATLAMVILALVANELDPATGDFSEGDTNLVLRLTEFQLDDGTFDWDLTDELEGDPAFSTPQAFLALVTYFHYVNTHGEHTNPYLK